MTDEQRPDLALQVIDTTILAKAVRGEIDLNELAAQELAKRGLDENGNWVGFNR